MNRRSGLIIEETPWVESAKWTPNVKQPVNKDSVRKKYDTFPNPRPQLKTDCSRNDALVFHYADNEQSAESPRSRRLRRR